MRYSRHLNNPGRRLVIKTLKTVCFIQKALSPCKFAHSALSCTKMILPAKENDAASFCDCFLKSQAVFLTCFYKRRFSHAPNFVKNVIFITQFLWQKAKSRNSKNREGVSFGFLGAVLQKCANKMSHFPLKRANRRS